ncbi:venom metalloproteinase antarease-like TtrivMP_A [Ixodes scapularis]|uniref:venom metalloproteinase antarease-like TtrivMP_A n=1 Tax=Ixodes scapularis TaxID=6945 RepID=UPI001C38F7C1|nr:venom metalloproteinase antarease-like TtrivMP_A [Ixodes scapularis]
MKAYSCEAFHCLFERSIAGSVARQNQRTTETLCVGLNAPKVLVFIALTFGELANAVNGARIVYPVVIEERSLDDETIVRVDEHFTLHLSKSSVIGDELHVSLNRNGKRIEQRLPGRLLSERLYHDRRHFAAISLEQSDGFYKMSGLLNATHSIEPLVAMARSQGGSMPHAVRAIQKPNIASRSNDIPNYKDDPEWFEKLEMARGWRFKHGHWPTDKFSNVTMKAIIVAEAKLLKKIYASPVREDPVLYLILYGESVALRLQALEYPGINMMLLGVYSAPKFIDRLIQQQRPPKMPAMEASLLMSTEGVIKRVKQHAAADVVLFLTQFNIMGSGTRKSQGDVYGYAVRGGVCSRNKYGFVKENGNYEGVEMAAVITARLLGAEYDGKAEASGCPEDGGYFMGTGEIYTPYAFSNCSRKLIKETLQKRMDSTCLNRKNKWSPVHGNRTYMGEALSPNEFCSSRNKSLSYCHPEYNLLPSTCTVDCCEWNGHTKRKIWTYFGLDGMACRSFFETYNTVGVSYNAFTSKLIILCADFYNPPAWSGKLACGEGKQ